MEIMYDLLQTASGWIGLAGNQRGLIGLVLPDPDQAAVRERLAVLTGGCPDGQRELYPGLRRQLIDYFQGKQVSLDFPVDWSIFTPFQARVLQVVRRIPWGETRSYRQVAEMAGCSRAYRAVGGAVGANRVPLVIPCHRVIGHDGSLRGFSSPGGVAEKRFLLSLEKRG